MFFCFWYGKYYVFCLGHLYKKNIASYTYLWICINVCVYAIRFTSIYYVYYLSYRSFVSGCWNYIYNLIRCSWFKVFFSLFIMCRILYSDSVCVCVCVYVCFPSVSTYVACVFLSFLVVIFCTSPNWLLTN